MHGVGTERQVKSADRHVLYREGNGISLEEGEDLDWVQDRELFWLAGYGEAVAQCGPEMNDYETRVRAQVFRRDQGLVSDLLSFQQLLRYNDYEQDSISQGSPVYVIVAPAIWTRTPIFLANPNCTTNLQKRKFF
jgi:hypothetical protein